MLALVVLAASAQAQTLAHRNWAGNGITSAAWWQNAVFYSIDVDSFQDSDGDGKGDLPGIIQRLDYLQSLGIDAILLQSEAPNEQFDELIRVANTRHIRVVVRISGKDKSIVGEARQWLTHGVAGIAVIALKQPAPPVPLVELRRLVESFPGDRVLIAFPDHEALPNDGAELVVDFIHFPSLLQSESTRRALAHETVWPFPHGSRPLRFSAWSSAISDANARAKIEAAHLLLRPGAAALNFGSEINAEALVQDRHHTEPVMSWTPTNLTSAPKAEDPIPATTAPDPSTYRADAYGGYRPYVAPKPKPKVLPAGSPPDPATLPGFSTNRDLVTLAPDIATANVATEEADPLSLLNFYRRLSQLHHDHPALRGGDVIDIDLSALQTFAWVVKPPASTRTARNLVVIANFSDKPKTLSLDDSLISLHLHPGGLRPLVASWTTTPSFQYTRSVMLPAFSVLAAEL